MAVPLRGKHDARLPKLQALRQVPPDHVAQERVGLVEADDVVFGREGGARDRKSTRLNSSHVAISYAVFCLKKKKSIWEYELLLSSCERSTKDLQPKQGRR